MMNLRRRLRDRGGDSGSALVEAAVISPVLLFLVFGIFEYGLIYRDWLTVSDAAADAARIGAVLGPDEVRQEDNSVVNADFKIVKAVREATAGIDPDWIERIVVFKVGPPSLGSPEDQLVEPCKNGIDGIPGVCNVYFTRPAFLAVQETDPDYFDCDVWAESPACDWAPRTRDEGPRAEDIDYLGIWIKVNRPYVTGLFGDDFEVSTAVSLRLEPGSTE
jgi:hypothetical protein